MRKLAAGLLALSASVSVANAATLMRVNVQGSYAISGDSFTRVVGTTAGSFDINYEYDATQNGLVTRGTIVIGKVAVSLMGQRQALFVDVFHGEPASFDAYYSSVFAPAIEDSFNPIYADNLVVDRVNKFNALFEAAPAYCESQPNCTGFQPVPPPDVNAPIDFYPDIQEETGATFQYSASGSDLPTLSTPATAKEINGGSALVWKGFLADPSWDFGGDGYTADWDSVALNYSAFSISAAPEPRSWALLLIGFMGGGLMLRRRREICGDASTSGRRFLEGEARS